MKHSFLGRLALACLVLGVTASTAGADPAMQQKVAEVLARFDHEPAVIDVQRAAATHAKVDPDAYGTWLDAAQFAYLLPDKLEGEIYRLDRDETDVRTTSAGSTPTGTVAADAHVRMMLEVRWNLTKIVFNPDKLRAAKEISNLVELREEILTTVNKLYFARREIQVTAVIAPPTELNKAIRTQLQIDTLTADLDALTGGWFSRELATRSAAKERRNAMSKAVAAPRR